MPGFYIDHNGPARLAALLSEQGFPTATARAEGLHKATDDHQLIHAAQTERVLITFNRKDFLLLHQAWCRWPQEWGLNPCPQHAGVFILDQQTAEEIVSHVEEILARQVTLTNQLHDWSKANGWRGLTPDGDLVAIT